MSADDLPMDDGFDDWTPGDEAAPDAPPASSKRESDCAEIPLGVDLARMTDDAIGALKTDPDVFVRGGQLARVVTHDGTDAIDRAVGA
ncbi:MAG TPA: hypothetical protein VGH87_13730, partial [Polyangiaceae bacterium]